MKRNLSPENAIWSLKDSEIGKELAKRRSDLKKALEAHIARRPTVRVYMDISAEVNTLLETLAQSHLRTKKGQLEVLIREATAEQSQPQPSQQATQHASSRVRGEIRKAKRKAQK